ncbi:MAG: ABC transporter ATP-binding protein [Candidatus Binatia bacterium]
MITFRAVTKRYSGHTAVYDFSLEIAAGERLVILGPSGSGKSTLLRLVAGFISPDSGSITIDGETVAEHGWIVKQPEERNVGMVFQDLALWPHLTVHGNVAFGLVAKRVAKREREQRIHEILALMQMQHYTNAKPAQLSGGQQQRVALARALVLRPKVLLMDEPLSNLDLELNIRLRGEVVRLQNTFGFTLLYVTHDRGEAFDVGTRVVVMQKEGRMVHSGPVEEVRKVVG